MLGTLHAAASAIPPPRQKPVMPILAEPRACRYATAPAMICMASAVFISFASDMASAGSFAERPP